MKRFWFVLLILFFRPGLNAQTTGSAPWAGVLAPSRAIVWNAGVVGGIPNRTNICTTLTSTATTAQIDSAITSCSNSGGGVVLLGAGTYSNATGSLCFAGASNVTLRGAGANQTLLAPTSSGPCVVTTGSINISSSDVNWKDGMSNKASWTAGYQPGTTTITLASVPNLKVGNPIILDQLNTTADLGGILVAQGTGTTSNAVSPGVNGPYSLQGDANEAAPCASSTSDANCYSQEQIVTVTQCDGVTTVGHACSSGTNITISPPLHMPNWSASLSPRAWWATHPALNDGVEDLSIDSTNNHGASGIEFFNCQNCWAKGVISRDTNEGHMRMEYANHVSIVNSYLFLTQNGATASYGIECYSGSDILAENNIMHAVVTPSLFETCTGSVVDYNYSTNNYYPAGGAGYNVNAHGDHSAGVDTELIEGNIGNLADADTIHGTHNLNTYFRNYYTGPQAACYSSGSSYATATFQQCASGLTPMQLYAFSRFYNVIGNILGTSGVNTVYSATTIGNTNVFLFNAGNGTPSDPNVAMTVMLWGNADSATGFGSPRFNCSEVPTALTGVQAPFTNPCPSSNALPASFYYSSMPSWWPSGKPWPPVGPDVTSGNVLVCTSGTYNNSRVTNSSQCAGGSSSTVAGGHVNSIPAMDCYFSLGGIPNGTGPALTNFNESTCYGQSVSSNPPQPPTNVKATAQ